MIMATKAAKTEVINIEPIKKVLTKVRIVGDSPLICHCWNAKAQREILEKEMGFGKAGVKEKKNPYEDFASSMYWLDKMPEEFSKETIDEAMSKSPRFGFPLTGLKQSAISAAYRLGWSKDKMSLRGAFFIQPNVDGYYGGDLEIVEYDKMIKVIPNVYHPEPMIEINYERITMRTDMVKVGMGSADIRYRGQLEGWSAEFMISYNENGLHTLDKILSMLNAGGYVCGIGEWRPERDGQFGMYHVEGV